MNENSVKLGEPYALPMKDWLVYTYALLYPFFMFAVFTTRDSVPFWVVVGMTLLVLFELFRSGGRFWIDRSFIFLFLLLIVYFGSTTELVFEDSAHTWLGRTPIDRAIAVDLRLLNVVIAFVVFINLLANAPEKTLMTIFRIQVIVGTILAMFGIIQFAVYSAVGTDVLSGVEPTNETYSLRSHFFRVGNERIFRATSIFSEPAYFGFYLVPLTVKVIVAWIRQCYVVSKKVHAIAVLVFITAIAVNFSFTALLSLVIVSIVFMFTISKRSWQSAIKIILVVLSVAVLILLSPLGNAISSRISVILEFRDPSTIDRLVRIYTSSIVFLRSPFVGVGPGGYAFWYPRLGGLQDDIMASPLNIWLSFLTDVGVVGFIPFVGFLWTVLRRSARSLNSHPLVAVYFWSVVSYLVLLTSADNWFTEMFWFELAMLTCLGFRRGLKDSMPDTFAPVARM